MKKNQKTQKNESLFHAIHDCDDKFLEETIDSIMDSKKDDTILPFSKKHHWKPGRVAVAALACVIILGAGASVAAATSSTFREWISNTFGSQNVTPATSTEPNEAGNPIISLKDDMSVTGTKESFIYQSKYSGDTEIVENVYGLKKNHLSPLEMQTFTGTYEGQKFSFTYSVQNNEIFGYNYTGAISEVFPVIRNHTIYAALSQIDGDDTISKECIAALHLTDQSIEILTDDNKQCNMLQSPDGSRMLLNYRSKEYWSVLNLDTLTEEKVDAIDPYAHTSDIYFIDDTHIATPGDTYTKNGAELTGINVIDLTTLKTSYYKNYGDIHETWTCELNGHSLTLSNIITSDSFTISDVTASEINVAQTAGDYVLLYGDDESYYLCNLAAEEAQKITLPKELSDEISMYLAPTEHQLLITDGTIIYLADISEQ